MRKVIISALLVSVFSFPCAAQDPTAQLGKNFRKAALRCSDAISRVFGASIALEPDAKYNPIELEASKALTEAKIEADSPVEKNVYKLLRAWYEFATVTHTFDLKAQIREPDKFDRYVAGAKQCSLEVRTIIDPDSIRKKEKDTASKVGCMDANAAMHDDLRK
jgi:hypothetical protein